MKVWPFGVALRWEASNHHMLPWLKTVVSGIGDELTTLQCRPEHLHVLADHVTEEPGHQHPHSDRCCDHCKNPPCPSSPAYGEVRAGAAPGQDTVDRVRTGRRPEPRQPWPGQRRDC